MIQRRHRALAALVLLTVAGSAAVGALAARSQLRAIEAERAEFVRRGTAVVASQLPRANGATIDLQRLAETHADLLRGRVTLIDAAGRVVADSALSESGVAAMDDHRARPEITQAALAGVGERIRRSATTGVEYLYGARRVDDDLVVRYARMAVPWAPVRAGARGHGVAVGGWCLLATTLVGGVAYLGLRRRERAVQRFAGAMQRAVEDGGTFDSRTVASPHLGGMTTAVLALEDALVRRYREVEADRTLLASVVAGMREGLLLVGADRRVRLTNAAVRRILSIDFDPLGRHVTDAVRHPAVIDEIDAALAEGGERSDSVVHVAATDQTFRLHSVTLERRGSADPEVLVLFFDITRLERLERVRREFVANVSHELRTPLTSIKAFVETLSDGGLDDREQAHEFLGIVRKHADRMGELIEDLTDLSLIETGAIRLEIGPVDANEIVRDVVGRLAPQIEARRLRVEIELPHPCTVHADRRRLDQVLTNLVDNAVKFSRPGGAIRIVGDSSPERTRLRVCDEGIGIARDAHEKVFHRFHRERRETDEVSRGTGLGLAIVKHLMRLHGGQVSVESELGQGASFTVEFPAAYT